MYSWDKITAKNIAIWASLTALVIVHLILLSKTFYIDSAGVIRTAGAGYGDIPYHLTEITKFAFAPFDVNEPIFYGTKLHYPFIINLISGLLLGLTGFWTFSVLAPAYIFAAASVFLTYIIYKKCFNHPGWAIAALIIFYFGSGMAGPAYIAESIANQEFQPRSSDAVFLTAKYPDQNITYGAPIVVFFLHQRTFVLGYFAFLCTVLLFILTYERQRWKYAIGAGIALGLMPLMHTHSFVAASCLLGCIILYALIKKNKLLTTRFGAALIIAILIATPQMLYLLGQKSFSVTNQFSVFRLGWMVPPGIASVQFPPGVEPSAFSPEFLTFLWMNLGFFIPLFIAGTVIVIRRFNKKDRNKKDRLHGYIGISLIVSALLFITANLVRFQPWEFDNNKIIAYAIFFAVPAMVVALRYGIEKNNIIGSALAVIIIAVLITGGIIDVVPRLIKPYSKLTAIFDTSAQTMAEYIRENVPYEDLILTGDHHLNPVVSLAGRPVLVGYPGWLWTHGISYHDRLNEIKAFYRSPQSNQTLLQKYPITYIVLDNQTRNDYKADTYFFEGNYERVFNSGQYALYRIR